MKRANVELNRSDALESPAYTAAVQAAIWGMPIVSMDAMRQAFFRDAHARYNDIVYWSKPGDCKLQIATPNASSHYVYSNFNTKDGPVVVEIPAAEDAGLFGSILDAWQVPVADVGPEGEDGGKGGKYLLMPPGYSGSLPAGYIPVRFDTFNGYAVFRSIPKSSTEADVQKAIALIRTIAIYPLSTAATPSPTRFVDMSGRLFDSIVRFDETFYESLARMVNEEPVQPRDKAVVDQLRTLGIQKDKDFKPSATTQQMFKSAAAEAHTRFVSEAPKDGISYWTGRQWHTPNAIGAQTAFKFETDSGLNVATRGLFYFLACAPPAKLGKATFYLTSFRDGGGKQLTGESIYRLRVPANVPANQFWALTIYDSETAAFIRDAPRVEVNSYSQELQRNADGSVDLYLGPKPPPSKKSNWINTSSGRPFFAIFRLYGPQKPLFDKTWQLPDIDRTSGTPAVSLSGTAQRSVMVSMRPASYVREGDGHAWIGTETVRTRLGSFDFKGGYPTKRASKELTDLLMLSRAVEVYLAQMPAVSWYRVWKAIKEAGNGAPNQLVIWEKLMDAQTLLLTGNSETVYGLMSFDLMRDGPIVVEVPSMLLGGVNDMWQHQLMDIGPTGMDKGKGGKILLLPPDYKDEAPSGYMVVKCPNYRISLGVRGFLVDGKPDKAVALLKTTRAYPLSQANTPRHMTFVNGSGKEFDTIFRDNYDFFSDLAELVEGEPVEVLSPHERFQLSAVGIEKGKPFDTDWSLQPMLNEAARLGSALARRNTFASSDPARVVYPDRRWEWAFIGGSATWDSQGYTNIDRRAAFAYAAIGMSPAMVDKVVGEGSQYLWTTRDSTGEHLDGGKSYRLTLPPHIPVKNFWSVVVYDAVSRSMLRNGQPFPTVSQYTGPAVNPDGSIDVYFSPETVPGKEKNWIKTIEGKGWFPLLRFYGPLEPFFKKTWQLEDIQQMA
jgi:hypothetical protein